MRDEFQTGGGDYSKSFKREAALQVIKNLPENLKQMLTEEDAKLPMPQYDADGLFKTNHQSSANRNPFKLKNLPTYDEQGPAAPSCDFERLQMLNHTQLNDPVLDSFLKHAKEMDQHAGQASHRSH